MESRNRLCVTAFLFLLGTSVSGAGAPDRGYLDRAYPVEKLDGKRIFATGLSRANTDPASLKNQDGEPELNPATADSLLRRFNAGLERRLASRLAKAKVELRAAPPEGTVLIKAFGDERIPDSLLIRIPSREGLAKAGLQADVSVILGKTVFGTRTILVPKITFAPAPQMPGKPIGKLKPWDPVMARLAPATIPRFPKDDGEIDTSVNNEKAKVYFSVSEFCFYDHAAAKPFGYGRFIVETKYHGKLAKLFADGRLDPGEHMEKMARELIDLLLRSDRDAVSKYAKAELEPAAPPAPKDETKEVLDTEEE